MVDLSLVLVIGGLIYLFFLRPYFEKKKDELEFDSHAIGFLESLHLSGIEFGCSIYEMRHYLECQLSKAHALPGNQSLIDYTAANGFHYYSHLGREDYKLFVLLCIAQYASDRDNTSLVNWCESKFEEARKIRF